MSCTSFSLRLHAGLVRRVLSGPFRKKLEARQLEIPKKRKYFVEIYRAFFKIRCTSKSQCCPKALTRVWLKSARRLMVRVCGEWKTNTGCKVLSQDSKGRFCFPFHARRIKWLIQLCNVSRNLTERGQDWSRSNPRTPGRVKKYKLPIVYCWVMFVILSSIRQEGIRKDYAI